MIRTLRIVSMLCLTLSILDFAAAKEPKHEHEVGDAHAGKHGAEGADALRMDAAARKQAGIETRAATRRALPQELVVPGEVRINAYRARKVAPRISAQVEKRRARLGDRVKPGTALAQLSSVQLAEAQAELIVAEREWRRVRDLGEKLVSARRYGEAKAARELAHAKVSAYGMSDAQITALLRDEEPQSADGRILLTTPIGGIVIADEFVEGEFIEPGRVLFEIADDSSLWVEVRVPPASGPSLTPDARVRVRTGNSWLEGKVLRSFPRVDEATRTLVARIEVSNPNRSLHPGQFVEVSIEGPATAASAVLAVPQQAVVLLQGEPTVFKLEGNEFHPVRLEIGETRGGWTEIKSGVAAGDQVVVQGMFLLKSRLLKSQLGEGHAH